MAGKKNKGIFSVSVCGEVIEEASRDGSHYTLSIGGILPSLGARSNRRVTLRRFIISPYDRRYSMSLWHRQLRCSVCANCTRKGANSAQHNNCVNPRYIASTREEDST